MSSGKGSRNGSALVAIKGQVTGPITFGMGLKDHQGRAVYYDLNARDAAVKLLALKAAYQVRTFKAFGCPVIVFLDEPALAGYGSSEMISIPPLKSRPASRKSMMSSTPKGGWPAFMSVPTRIGG
jgi:hypothetical protein